MIDLRCGDCLDVMRGMDEACVDTIITDPPYGLEFMGKDWDHGVPGVEFWKAALRVAKPGAFLLAFGGTRTWHRLAVAIEDAGWEIRDTIMWLYGSGFPKSHDISKAIDKAAGAEREVVGDYQYANRKGGKKVSTYCGDWADRSELKDTSPTTPAAQQWDGWGTALKPAYEIICVAMKPIEGTFAENALKWGVAGLNIDGARIPTNDDYGRSAARADGFVNKGEYFSGLQSGDLADYANPAGRWPANVILDEAAAAALDEQSGERKSGGFVRGTEPSRTGQNGIYGVWERVANNPHCDTGGASRFFYCAKASRSERDAGLEGMPEQGRAKIWGNGLNTDTKCDPILHTPEGVENRPKVRNIHPCVKPLALMRYLCTLTMTPTGGVVLDPFMGSGSTGIAAKQTGRNFIGIEIDPGYYEIARRRIERAKVETQLRLEGV